MSDGGFGGERPGSGGDASDTRTDETLVSDGGSQTDDDQRMLEGVLRALLNQRRRYTLYFLQATEVSEVDELATHVAAMEQDTDPETVDPDQVEKVQVSLVHSDLPMLEDQGLVEFDRRSSAVRYSRPPELLDKMLSLCATFDTPEISPQ